MHATTTRPNMTGLESHLRSALGMWPPRADKTVSVATSRQRAFPGWDGVVVPAVGLETPSGTVVSVPPHLLHDVAQTLAATPVDPLDGIGEIVRERLARESLQRVVYRWLSPTEVVADLDDIGDWHPRRRTDDPLWLEPFDGGVLIATVDGRHAGALGLKAHDEHVAEIAVVVPSERRESGIARRLVAQATRAILASGRTALYLHLPDNTASARVAEAVGYSDEGWRLLEWPPRNST